MAESGGRLDRELNELLQELRVLLPGVQVLFAFLLILPFNSGFHELDDAGRALYFGVLAFTTLSALLLVAPSVRHRGRFRDRDKEALILSSNRLALWATVSLAIAISGVVALIAEYLYGWLVGGIAGGMTAAVAAWFWYGWALMRERRDRS